MTDELGSREASSAPCDLSSAAYEEAILAPANGRPTNGAAQLACLGRGDGEGRRADGRKVGRGEESENDGMGRRKAGGTQRESDRRRRGPAGVACGLWCRCGTNLLPLAVLGRTGRSLAQTLCHALFGLSGTRRGPEEQGKNWRNKRKRGIKGETNERWRRECTQQKRCEDGREWKAHSWG